MSLINSALKFFGTMNKYEITAKINMREKEEGKKESSLEEVEKKLEILVKNKTIGKGIKTLDGIQYYTYKPNKG